MADVLVHAQTLPAVATLREVEEHVNGWLMSELVSFMDNAKKQGAAYARVIVPIPPLSPLSWLTARQDGYPRDADGAYYWMSRDESLEIAALGFADVWSHKDTSLLKARLVTQGGPPWAALRALATVRFDSDAAIGPEWSSYGSVTGYVPFHEVVRSGDKHALAVTVPLGASRDGDAQDLGYGTWQACVEVEQLRPAHPRSTSEFHVESSLAVDGRSASYWTKLIRSVLGSIARGTIAKGVLARRSAWTSREPSSALDVFSDLHDAHPGTYRFYLRPPTQAGKTPTAFFGASPERLYVRNHRSIETEALAGTRPRGKNALTDKALRTELLASEKDAREQRLVLDQLRVQLADLCNDTPSESTLGIRAHTLVQHLCTSLKGTLREGVTDAEIIDRLHPTPAVCGEPVEAARMLLRQLEGFDRGLYAGPVGIIGSDDAEFAVAIRSGRMDGRKVTLYAGAGIVEGSTPEEEWEETATKMRTISDLLRAGPGA